MARARNARGFAGLSPEAKRRIARAGGQAAHQSGHAHEWNSEEARAAGRLGGLAAHHHQRAAFHHETAAHHHQRAATHHATGNRSRARLHAENAYAHEQRAGEHAELAFRTNRARDQDERDDDDNLDRIASQQALGRGARTISEFADDVEPRRSQSGTNVDRRGDSDDRQDEPDYGVNGRSESTGTARGDR